MSKQIHTHKHSDGSLTVRFVWNELEENEKPDDEEIPVSRYRKQFALDTAMILLEKTGIKEPVLISCPRWESFTTDEGKQIRIPRWHSSAVWLDELPDDDGGSGWSLRLWRDVTMGKRMTVKHKQIQRNLMWVKDTIDTLIGNPDTAEKLACTFINTVHTMGPMFYAHFKGLNLARFAPTMWRMANEELHANITKTVCSNYFRHVSPFIPFR